MSDDTLPLFVLCSVPGCGRPLCARGWCRPHWAIWQRTGDPVKRNKLLAERPCPICGVGFLAGPNRPEFLTCGSPECKAETRRIRYRRFRERHPKPQVPKRATECACCGRVFGANKRRFTYCSDACRELHSAARSMLRTRRMKALPFEKFTRMEIFQRDGWCCGLCGDAIDPSLSWPDPQSATVDHVIPVSKGGPHLRSNVQAAHAACNFSKGNRVAA